MSDQRASTSPASGAPAVAAADGREPWSDIERRLLAWRTTLDPRHLWPALDESERVRALAAIERVVASILRGDARPPSLGDARGRDAPALGVAAFTSGTGALLGYWVEQGRLDVSERLARVLAEHLAHGRARAERVERELLPTLDLLQEHGVDCTILKGFHTARRYFPDKGTRPFTDVDLLVTPTDVARAERILQDAGFVSGGITRVPYKRDWYPSGVDRRVRSLELNHALNPWHIELHASLDRRFQTSSRLRVAEGDLRREPWEVRGRRLWVLAQPLLFATLAAHTSEALRSTRLVRLIELVLVARDARESGSLDWRALDALFERDRGARFLFPALALAERLAPGTIDQRTLAAAQRASTALARHLVRRMTPADAAPLGRIAAGERLMWVAGPREFFARLARLVVPLTGSPADVRESFLRRVHLLSRAKVTFRPESETGLTDVVEP